MEKVFNKLVRDKVPEIIEKEGLYTLTKTLDKKELNKALNEKILEEANEVINATTKESIKEELADLLEVIYAKAKACDIDIKEVEKCRISKKDAKGTFSDGIFLIKSVDQKYVDENKGCLTCANGSCSFPIEEKYDLDEDGKPAGYYCIGYNSCYKKKYN